jgi:hypothetical protein
MNHAVTIGGLLAILAMLLGIFLGAIGVLTWFAGGMATAPDEKMGRVGCSILLLGVALVAASAWVLRS